MSAEQRPGGLTALAVLNFVFGGLGAIGMMAILAVITAADEATHGDVFRQSTSHPGAGLAWTNLLLALGTVILLIVSGVGYLGQKRFLGRTMGNAYAICSLAQSAVGFMVGGFGIMGVIFLVYPVLTLALINGTFKGDLVN